MPTFIDFGRGAHAGVVLALLIGLMLLGPSAAQADCGGVQKASPAHHPPGQRPPLAIGDSTMLLAMYDLVAAGYEVNAHGCRQFPEALALLRARRAAGTLPHMVLIALGADGSVSHADIGETLGILGPTRLLVLLTPRELGGGSGSDAATVREEVSLHPTRTRLLDWVQYSAGRPGWFQPDGVHLTMSGALAFTRMLKPALAWAYRPLPKSGLGPISSVG